jgi:hypothetical protein
MASEESWDASVVDNLFCSNNPGDVVEPGQSLTPYFPQPRHVTAYTLTPHRVETVSLM